MMRWNPAGIDDAREERGPAAERPGLGADVSAAQYLLDAVADAITRLGGRSLVLIAMLALIVVTLVFGLSIEDVAAGARWCKECG